jgi:predicted Zn-dependent peptidase
MADLDAASVADVADFFRIYYAPNNAVLTLVGDFDPGEALAKVKKYFGAIPAQPPPPKLDLREEPHYGERRETIADPLARVPRLDMAYRIPPGNTSDNYAMQQLAIALAQGQSSRFYQHLVKDKQLATNVNVRPDSRIGPSQFYISASPRPGVSIADLEKGLDEEIAAVVKDGITSDELAKARAQFLRRFIDQRRSSLQTARLIGEYAVKFDDPNLINTILDKQNGITVELVNRAAKTYLARDQRTIVITIPASGERPSPRSAPAAAAQ